MTNGSLTDEERQASGANCEDSNALLFSPKDQRKRRVPLSSVNNLGSRDESENQVGSHSAVKNSNNNAAASPACDLITSSQRKKSKKKRLTSTSGERENVFPRNLNKTFTDEVVMEEQEGSGNAAVEDDADEEAAAAAGQNADDSNVNGVKRGGGVLSNLLFSPMFTLLGPKFSSKFASGAVDVRTINPLATSEFDTLDENEAGASEDDQMAAAADLNCEEKSLEEEESYEYADEDDSEVEYEYSQNFDPFYFIKNLPPLEVCVPAYRENLLPKQTRQTRNKKTLVLDLDETLVHSSLENELPQDSSSEHLTYDFTFPVHLGEDRYDVYVYVRPGAIEFLEKMQEHFEVVIFTASQKMYAEKLLNILDPKRRYIRHRLFRDSCVLVEGNYLKDLSVIGRDLKDTIIVDNSPQAFAFQLSNGVPIESWFDDQEDRELLKLIPFLKKLTKVDDVRPSIEKKFKLHTLVQNA